MSRRWQAVVLVVVALVVAWPALRRPPTDGFPLSTYPMFASDRGAESVVATAVGRTPDGQRVRLSPEVLAGTDEPMLAVSTARRAVASDDADTWCGEVARRASGTTDGGEPVAAIEVVVETHDAVAHFVDDAPPLDVEVHATCAVPTR
ncbi:hypothetical protein [Actinomarinicola tropica]|uniref:Uncharacterized protein n=1 Tax=Actinomarinicola tropica TaxID=2789776 RepID=A0A5Q2RL41_9ACTN|nr:hypothetical protein [Actinomarinicola tropica]QGG96204.1 hypothetical protein GH723_14445 [Actinomarinicola tropica]